jgi:hypothetical protein
MDFKGSPIEFTLNVLMNDYNKNGTINETIDMFPTLLIVDCLSAANGNKNGVKKGSEGLLTNVISAIERHLKLQDSVIKAEKLSTDIMEEYI